MSNPHIPPIPLDSSLYSLDEAELAFFKAQTGIQDEEELKKHIIAVQEKAYKVYPYPCIRRFSFTKIKVARLPGYKMDLMEMAKNRKGAIFLDIGCGFGNATRKVVFDGFPIEGVIASDLRREFWDFGHELFKSTPETFPVPFIQGDAFDSNFIAPNPVLYDEPPTEPTPPLASLTSLNPLRGYISAIHASSFFHLFSEDLQRELGERLASLLSPLPGSIIFGSHIGLLEKGLIHGEGARAGFSMFCHSPQSWRELWNGGIFKKGSVQAFAMVKEVERTVGDKVVKMQMLVWCVKRLADGVVLDCGPTRV
ncbi:hypothetical protein JAAARDRAFT_29353 [Jaapia argillacea MUCL 33604]|uniref:Methyltransferase domain-containing protein n=1 Tax=Jaapia argillacea MUCL 33604 TaxID=933084 RepID=A0A067QII4_9AGAM|nr:hypothetical protein JAAARDRAFT_29353 [Jaapia argillacea MUCL 33604]